MYKPKPNPRAIPDPFRSTDGSTYRVKCASEKIPTVYPAQFKIKQYAAGPQSGTWRVKGTMSGGISSSMPVARAFIGTRG